mgnify:CR=1 FL=1
MTILVDDLLSQVRSQTDEDNTEDITDAQILQALNRGQRNASNILARRLESMMWESTEITSVSGQRNYSTPADAYGSRIEMIEVATSTNIRYKLQRMGNHKSTNFVTSAQTDIPTYYTQKRNEFEVYPTPKGGLTIIVHYNKKPEDMVLQQGRISSIDTTNNYVIVDNIGSDISTTSSTSNPFGLYLNVIDYNTGNIKRSLQVSALDTTAEQITFKAAGLTRSTVLGRTIETSIGSDVAVDDYVCLVTGTCVPEVDEAYTDYILQHTVIAIKRRLGEPVVDEKEELVALENELSKAWAGREHSHRVRKASKSWVNGNSLIQRRLLT